jgi:hypothetical protein
MHTVNSRYLKDLIKALGDSGLARTSIGAMVSVSSLEKMISGTYKSSPREPLRKRLCEFFNASEADLFPLARKRSVKAS